MNGDEVQAPGEERRLWLRFVAHAAAPAACPDPMAFAAWIDGGAADPQAAAIELHLAECAECREAVAELRRSVRGVAGGLVPAPDAVVKAGKSLVGSRQTPRGRQRGLGLAIAEWGMAAAASIAICMAGYQVGSGRLTVDPAGADEVLLEEMSFGLLGGLPQRDTGILVTFEELSR